MSRLPLPSSSARTETRTRLKSTPSSPTPRSTATPKAAVTPLAKPRARTPSTLAAPSPTPSLRSQRSLQNLKPKSPTKSPSKRPPPLPTLDDAPRIPKLSIREQIALKRAEVKKVVSPLKATFEDLEDASPDTFGRPAEPDVDLGRWSIKEAIERARSSGAINIASRDLPCIPSALFEIHLGITPEPLKSAPVEPPITTSSSSKQSSNGPTWYDAQDLEILKAWSNEIVELQPEISMFGSLKTVDLHNNKLTSLPDSFADLVALMAVDLSHNELKTLPTKFWALPHLTTLNLAYNALCALPFSVAFGEGSNPLGRTKDARGDWFQQAITRATEPLPRLTHLNVSHNPLTAASIDVTALPAQVTKLDLSAAPLGKSDTLLCALGRLKRLTEVRMVKADIGDDSFSVSIFASSTDTLFPALKVLDLEETQVSRPVIEATFIPPAVKQTVQYDVTAQEPPAGVLRVVLGKRVIKEAWEIDTERRSQQRRQVAFPNIPSAMTGSSEPKAVAKAVVKEPWEEKVLSEGAKRRARAQAAASPEPTKPAAPPSTRAPPPVAIKAVQKEAWEIEAESGMLSAGARRRARAQAVAAAQSHKPEDPTSNASSRPASRTPSPTKSPTTVGAALAHPQYYDAPARTLTLPPSAPPAKATHTRSFSLAAPRQQPPAPVSELALAIPAPTLPLAAIAELPLAHNLKVLVLANRRADVAFALPAALAGGGALPYLEELSFANCNLPEAVPVARVDAGSETAPRVAEPLLPLLARLFPSVRTLDLSYNQLSSAALTKEALSALIFASDADARKGLRALRLRGNRIDALDGFKDVAERFRGNRDVPEWHMEELDLRDNEIGKMPAELGLLPLEVFLVDGNVFRVPPRRVWEREGTKGLLGWLRGRIE
ncbi:uncharacterized protein BXZ73DRAFT_51975 [Epithele typhae]|uniref:uncharacterized protein n=1 Tax=Epithele typhae TaxID=378194 RepID=UPI0020087D1E|nr:uncharacterized protein BXZ73DRAFT_51975 [Epithele typhae]KAH9921234.1 hypothetical protein BXZ73DRAFT_51975 [Epithele typhae]